MGEPALKFDEEEENDFRRTAMRAYYFGLTNFGDITDAPMVKYESPYEKKIKIRRRKAETTS